MYTSKYYYLLFYIVINYLLLVITYISVDFWFKIQGVKQFEISIFFLHQILIKSVKEIFIMFVLYLLIITKINKL